MVVHRKLRESTRCRMAHTVRRDIAWRDIPHYRSYDDLAGLANVVDAQLMSRRMEGGRVEISIQQVQGGHYDTLQPLQTHITGDYTQPVRRSGCLPFAGPADTATCW